MAATEIISGLFPNAFYEQPTPLIFGDFPWDINALENRDTYEYVKMYSVPRLCYMAYYPQTSSPGTIQKLNNRFNLFYNTFFNKYTLVSRRM